MPEILNYLCPFCEYEVRVGEPCPGCANKTAMQKPKAKAKAKSKANRRPWHQASSQQGLDLPEEGFDYDAFVAREFGKSPHQALGVKWYWWLLGVAILSGMVAKLFL